MLSIICWILRWVLLWFLQCQKMLVEERWRCSCWYSSRFWELWSHPRWRHRGSAVLSIGSAQGRALRIQNVDHHHLGLHLALIDSLPQSTLPSILWMPEQKLRAISCQAPSSSFDMMTDDAIRERIWHWRSCWDCFHRDILCSFLSRVNSDSRHSACCSILESLSEVAPWRTRQLLPCQVLELIQIFQHHIDLWDCWHLDISYGYSRRRQPFWSSALC